MSFCKDRRTEIDKCVGTFDIIFEIFIGRMRVGIY